MSARRFFIEGAHSDGETVAIGDADARKIVHVLRLKSGDRIEAIDSTATVFEGDLAVDAGNVRATLSRGRKSDAGIRVRIDVAQAVPKGQKMDFVIEKLTELGAAAVVPFESDRSVARNTAAGKIERWRRLARTAAAQSGRATVMEIVDVQSFDGIVQRFSRYDAVLVPWEALAPAPLASRLPHLVADAGNILIVIGPEGGFSHEEMERAVAAGAHLISLGERILRTETAALMLLSVLAYVLG